MKVTAENLGRRFGRHPALRDATFTCADGDIVALIGNNGAGKTTLLQLLSGLLAPTQGAILFDGRGLDRRDESQRAQIAFVPDFPPFFNDHTVLRHIAMVCTLHHKSGAELETRALADMEEIGILHLGSTLMATLSRGEIYKTIFVALLLVQPRLWLLDEPMASGMDPQGLNFLKSRLSQEAASGATVFYSTQIAEVAERFGNRIFVLQEGRLAAQESTESLRMGASNPALQEILHPSHESLR